MYFLLEKTLTMHKHYFELKFFFDIVSIIGGKTRAS
jgi:hypothetical protein